MLIRLWHVDRAANDRFALRRNPHWQHRRTPYQLGEHAGRVLTPVEHHNDRTRIADRQLSKCVKERFERPRRPANNY